MSSYVGPRSAKEEFYTVLVPYEDSVKVRTNIETLLGDEFIQDLARENEIPLPNVLTSAEIAAVAMARWAKEVNAAFTSAGKPTPFAANQVDIGRYLEAYQMIASTSHVLARNCRPMYPPKLYLQLLSSFREKLQKLEPKITGMLAELQAQGYREF